MLDADAKKCAEDLERARSHELTNLEQIFVLSQGTMEDYFPKNVIRQLLNGEDFNASPEITEKDLPDSLCGEKLLSAISRLMHERKCGKGLSYFKTVLGLKGVKLMKGLGVDIDNEIKNVVLKVAEIASRV
ncbi:MAG: hypothetical protein B7Z37_06400 [Verrucomicrobia bacterium 12-59-8]|nr:MAG: hypothetical protein B7Z37_06400 [Verrucomicrobia bacterium 12-59-8]